MNCDNKICENFDVTHIAPNEKLKCQESNFENKKKKKQASRTQIVKQTPQQRFEHKTDMLVKGRAILDHKHSGETVSGASETNVGKAYGVPTKNILLIQP